MDNTIDTSKIRKALPIRRIGLTVALGLVICLAGCSGDKGQSDTPAPPKEATKTASPAQTQTPPASTSGAGGVCSALLTAKCTECHSLARVCEKLGKKSNTRWQRTIDRMVDRGAKVNTDEKSALLACLESGATNDLQEACR